MAKKREYLISCFDNGKLKFKLRAPRSVNPNVLLERLICRDLDCERIVRSCLRKNSKDAHDPFHIRDMRQEHRSEMARSNIPPEPTGEEILSAFADANVAPIALGKTLLMGGINPQYFIQEVEAH
jgi:hypothetical protein